jgi:hypothetical protein
VKTLVKNIDGKKIIMGVIPQVLSLDRGDELVSPFTIFDEFRFSLKALPFPRSFLVSGLTVSTIKGGIEKSADEISAFTVRVQIGCLVAQDWVSLFHLNEALSRSPIEVPAQTPLTVQVKPVNAIKGKGIQIALSFRGSMLLEVM